MSRAEDLFAACWSAHGFGGPGSEPLRQHRPCPEAGWRFDFAWLDVECGRCKGTARVKRKASTNHHSDWPESVFPCSACRDGRIHLRIAVEIDGLGFGHQAAAGRARDMAKQNWAVLHGWRVLRYEASKMSQKQDAHRLAAVADVMSLMQREAQP